jgi:ribose transport system permease protein
VVAAYRIWPVLLLLVICAAIASHGIFLRPSNLISILFITAPTALASIGETLVILTAGIDLSVAAVWTLSAVVAGSLVSSGVNLPVAIAAALCVGLSVGIINGVLIGLLRIPPLITTLGTLSAGEGVSRVYTGNMPVLSMPSSYGALGSADFGPFPLPVLILLTATLALTFVMIRMTVGKCIYAVGGNSVAAHYAGIPVARSLIFAYSVSGLLAALAGILQSAYVLEALPNVDMQTLFAVIAGVVVGGTALTGGRGNIINSVGGVLVIVTVENTMDILGISPFFTDGVLGIIVLFAVYLNLGFEADAFADLLKRLITPAHRT